MKLTFVESRVFTTRWRRRLDDERLRDLQNELLEDPTRGDPIPGCPLLRKLRLADQDRGKGKRDGLRVIYVHTPEASRIDLVTVYGKDEADDLTKDQLSVLCRLAEALRNEAKSRAPRRAANPKD
jgi:mRNA-degrading endonuclease RelE of RelBE toxin-antitoxin system